MYIIVHAILESRCNILIFYMYLDPRDNVIIENIAF